MSFPSRTSFPAARIEIAQLRDRLERMRVENERLRRENRDLRATLDAHVTRAGATRLFGPLELTAGTCVGPRRRAALHKGGRP